MKKQYKSVMEMVEDTFEDNEFVSEFKEDLKTHQISKMLFVLRNSAGLSQADIAGKLECTQGEISKLEHLEDSKFSLKNLMAYCDAVGKRIEIVVKDKSATKVDDVKYHILSATRDLDDLQQLCKDDEVMREGAIGFFQDTALNFGSRFVKVFNKLLPKQTPSPPTQLLNVTQYNDVEDRKKLTKT